MTLITVSQPVLLDYHSPRVPKILEKFCVKFSLNYEIFQIVLPVSGTVKAKAVVQSVVHVRKVVGLNPDTEILDSSGVKSTQV